MHNTKTRLSIYVLVLLTLFTISFVDIKASIQAGFPVLSRSGNTTGYMNFTGSFTPSNCTKTDASGNLIDAGAPCGTGTPTHSFICNIGNKLGTSVIVPGDTGCYISVGGNSGTINRVDTVGNAASLATCSITVDVDKKASLLYPNNTTDKISASAPATLSSAVGSSDTTLSGWSKTVVAGDVFNANVQTVTGCVGVSVEVFYQ